MSEPTPEAVEELAAVRELLDAEIAEEIESRVRAARGDVRVPYTGEKAAEETKRQAIATARAAIRGAHYTEEQG